MAPVTFCTNIICFSGNKVQLASDFGSPTLPVFELLAECQCLMIVIKLCLLTLFCAQGKSNLSWGSFSFFSFHYDRISKCSFCSCFTVETCRCQRNTFVVKGSILWFMCYGAKTRWTCQNTLRLRAHTCCAKKPQIIIMFSANESQAFAHPSAHVENLLALQSFSLSIIVNCIIMN